MIVPPPDAIAALAVMVGSQQTGEMQRLGSTNISLPYKGGNLRVRTANPKGGRRISKKLARLRGKLGQVLSF